MKQVKEQIAQELFNALHQANLADVCDGSGVNDLKPINSSQDNLYGHLSEAIKALGYEAQLKQYIETGDRPNLEDQ